MPTAVPSTAGAIRHSGRALRRGAPLLLLLLTAACVRRVETVASPEAAPIPGLSADEASYLRSRRLIVPVPGVAIADIPDSFDAGRSGGRAHHAVDIMAPRGTPVLAADDGRVLKLRHNSLGGTTIYAVDPEGRFIYYYAHLDRYRAGLREGEALAKGDTIGYVGTTGNAPKNQPHLHFQVSLMPPDHKWWTGRPVDPLPLFVATRDDDRRHASSQD